MVTMVVLYGNYGTALVTVVAIAMIIMMVSVN